MLPRFSRTPALVVLLAAAGLLLAPLLRAAAAAPAPAKAADAAPAANADKPAKTEKAAKKAAKAKKDDAAPAKDKAEVAAPADLPVGVDEESVKKAYPELFKMREKVLVTGADLRELKAAATTKEKKKAEKEMPKLEKRFKIMLDRLTKEYEKQLKPIDDEKQTLVTLDSELSSRLSAAEGAGKKTDKLILAKNELTKRMTANEQKQAILRWLTTIPPIDDK